METNQMATRFARRFDKRYTAISNVEGEYVDPATIVAQVADYRDGVVDPRARIADFDAASLKMAEGGVPQFGVARPNNNVSFDLLNNPASGLTPGNAAMLHAALSQYEGGIVEGIQVPVQTGLPLVSNELGMVTQDGGIPQTFLNQTRRPNYGPDLNDVAARVAARQPSYIQQVDENGVVQKYAPGTGPYDAPGLSRAGGIAGAKRGTVVHSAVAPAQKLRSAPTLTSRGGAAVGMLGQVDPDAGVETTEKETPWGSYVGIAACGMLVVLGATFFAQGVQ
jgi:hypothetical protein